MKEYVDFVHSRDPQAKARLIDPLRTMLNAMGRTKGEKIAKAIGNAGMMPLELIDQWTILIGWRAVYDKTYRDTMRENPTLTEAELDKRATKAAQDSTLKNQPASREKDLPSIYNSKGLRWFLMFTQPLNQIWNMMAADVPTAVKRGQFTKAFGYIFSIALMGAVYGVIQRKRPQEDEEEFAKDLFGQALGSIPIIGREMNSWLTRGRSDVGFTMMPLFGQMMKTGGIFADDSKDAKDKVDAFVRMMTDANKLTGLPSTQLQRMYKAFISKELGLQFDPWEVFGGAPKEK
jgi:hypothetical protein